MLLYNALHRQGAFECHPDLAMFRGPSDSGASQDPENECPSSFFSAELPPGGQGDDSEDSEMEEVEGGGGEGGVEVKREVGESRVQQDYEKSALDFMSLGSSRGREEGGTEERGMEGGRGGLFGTLSSLLSSTFSRSTS